MQIREIEAKDLTSISSLYVSVFSNPPWNEYWEYDWAYERLIWIFNSQGFYGYIAEVDSTIVGAILGHFIPFQGKKGFKILEFFVASQFRQKGFGSKLLNTLEFELKANSYDFITLLTAKSTQAESFYLNRKYQVNEELELLNKPLL